MSESSGVTRSRNRVKCSGSPSVVPESTSKGNLSILIALNEPQSPESYLRACAPSEDSDQPARSRRLIRIFAGHILDSQGCKVSSCGERRLWFDCADSQADLSLRWAHVRRYVSSRYVSVIY